MVSIPKFVGLLSCGAVLCMGLSHNALAANEMSGAADPKGGSADHQKNDQMKGAHSDAGKTIKGEVVRVEGDNYFVKGQDGKEVHLQIDGNTQKTGTFNQGDRIEATVNDQNRALSIRSARGTEAGQSKESGRKSDSMNDSGKTGSSGSTDIGR
ncbi:MAG: hypothetical protein Q7U39_14965 [Nitrospira sp.]|nr:hypothetical protein [Nitrospira sp.]